MSSSSSTDYMVDLKRFWRITEERMNNSSNSSKRYPAWLYEIPEVHRTEILRAIRWVVTAELGRPDAGKLKEELENPAAAEYWLTTGVERLDWLRKIVSTQITAENRAAFDEQCNGDDIVAEINQEN